MNFRRRANSIRRFGMAIGDLAKTDFGGFDDGNEKFRGRRLRVGAG
jgi:hypothetical protein